MLDHLIAGFIINLTTSADDALTDIPVLGTTTKTKKGRIAYAIGKLIAVTLAVAIAYVLSRLIAVLPYPNIIVSSLVFIMAFVIYFNVLSFKSPKRVAHKVEKTVMSRKRFIKLMVLGFFMTFVTMLDDMFTLAPLFIDSARESLAALVGIYTATLVLIFIVMFFTRQITAIPYKREIATGTLIIFGFLLLFGVL